MAKYYMVLFIAFWLVPRSIGLPYAVVIIFDKIIKVNKCFDKIQNGNETDIDCGGSGEARCQPCQVGQKCTLDFDCYSALCYNSSVGKICKACNSSYGCEGNYYCRNGSCQFSGSYGSGCFSANDEVQLINKELKPMHDLQAGDKVWALCDNGKLCLTDVIRIPHADPNMAFLFFTVETSHGHRLSLSNNHYILVHQHGYLSGDQLTLNHSVYIADFDGNMVISPIINIKRELKYGVYQPVTLTGTLLVNGIVASSYLNNLQLTHEQLHDILAPLRWWYHATRLFGDLIHKSAYNKLFVHWAQKRLIWYRGYFPLVYQISGGFLTIILSVKLMKAIK